ncbi:MAG: hypothetical protein ACFCUE_07090 [Candidatus Bathyarchaeia archaeon]|jgi:hypothetical protein
MNRAQKVLLLTAALSYAIYSFYWLIRGTFWFAETLLYGYQLPPTGVLQVNPVSLLAANLMDFSAFLGLIIRAVGGAIAVLAVYQIFKASSNFMATKGKIVKVLICEAVYFLSLIPSIIFLLGFSALTPLSIGFLSAQLTVQILFIVPCLALLASKLRKSTDSSTVVKSAAILFLSYISALWLTYQLKWLELFNGAQVNVSTVFGWLIENARLLSFLNTTVIFTVALLFAVMATKYTFASKRAKAVRMWGLSAFFVGLFFVFYVLYCSYLGAYWVIPFGELWLIPLLLVGIYFLIHPLSFSHK